MDTSSPESSFSFGSGPIWKKLLIALAALVILCIAAAVVFYFIGSNKLEQEQIATEEEAVQGLSDSLEADISGPEVVVPSANPVKAAAPAVNPIGKANPFNETYENPFE